MAKQCKSVEVDVLLDVLELVLEDVLVVVLELVLVVVAVVLVVVLVVVDVDVDDVVGTTWMMPDVKLLIVGLDASSAAFNSALMYHRFEQRY